MDPSVLEMKYAEMLKHAKDLGITFSSSKPKKEQIVELITEHYEKAEKIDEKKSSRKLRHTVKSAEGDEEPKVKKLKKVKSSKTTENGETEEKNVKKKKVKKSTRTDKAESVEEPVTEAVIEAVATEPEVKPKKVKKTLKGKVNLVDNETDEMKRVRKSILERKAALVDKSNAEQLEDRAGKKLKVKSSKKKVEDAAASAAAGTDEKSKKKKIKKITFSDNDVAELAGDTSSAMRRRILKKKKKSSSPVLKPSILRRGRSKSVEQEQAHVSILDKTNELIEEQEVCDEQFQLQLDSDDETTESIEKEPVQSRRSIAFTIDNSTPVVAQPRKSILSDRTTPSNRKSIAFTIDNSTPTVVMTKQSPVKTTSTLNRRSIAFTIANTPEQSNTPARVPPKRRSSMLSSRRSIRVAEPAQATPTTNQTPNHQNRTIVIHTHTQSPNGPPAAVDTSLLTNDDSNHEHENQNTTYEKSDNVNQALPSTNLNSPMVSCASFYKPNVTLDLDQPEVRPNDQPTEPVVVSKPVGRARIVRPKQVTEAVESIFKAKRSDPTDVVVKKVVEVVSREAGPRITKPTLPEKEEPKRKPAPVRAAKKKVVPKVNVPIVQKVTTPKSATKKVPDFKAIHERNFNKSEDVTEASKRVQNRHNQYFGAKTHAVVAPVVATQQETVVSSLMSHATNILKKITPFGGVDNKSDENVPKEGIKSKQALKEPTNLTKKPTVRESHTASLKPRTPLGVHTLNTQRTPGNLPSTPTNLKTPTQTLRNAKTPQSNKTQKSRPTSLLLSAAKKPTLAKPFQFQNQNLESNYNFGGACQFQNTGRTPLKESAFNRRKSYNPLDSMGRPLTYHAHHGRIKPLDSTKSTNLNESISVRAAAALSAQEKRKSIFGMQKNLEKEKLGAKRKVMRNTEMDRPRVL